MNGADARVREAALLLHGLGPQQREAVLSRLDAGHRATLQPLLEELAALGIPSSLAQAQARAQVGGTPAAPDRRGDAAPAPDRERLAVATLEPRRAARALRGCAVPTVAAVLRDAPLAWRAAVLAELPRDLRRDAAEHIEHALPLPPRVEAALHRRLCEAAAGAVGPGRAAALRRPAGWTRWWPWSR